MNWYISICVKIPNEKKDHPHIIWKFQANLANMASATALNMIWGQSLQSHFIPIWELALLIQSFIFSNHCFIFAKLKDYLANPSNWPHSGQDIADFHNNQQVFFWKILKASDKQTFLTISTDVDRWLVQDMDIM